jgi:hypothetical protein
MPSRSLPGSHAALPRAGPPSADMGRLTAAFGGTGSATRESLAAPHEPGGSRFCLSSLLRRSSPGAYGPRSVLRVPSATRPAGGASPPRPPKRRSREVWMVLQAPSPCAGPTADASSACACMGDNVCYHWYGVHNTRESL